MHVTFSTYTTRQSVHLIIVRTNWTEHIMGAAESNPVKNLDKRTARRTYRDAFKGAIERYRSSRKVQAQHAHLAASETVEWEEGTIRVCVRKRPIFKDEIKGSEFDVLTCMHDKLITVHDARMHADMVRQLMNHHEFLFDRVFDAKAGNDEVYQGTAAPLVKIAAEGGFATCLMYGQTGSGKTYTMSSIYERAAVDVFRLVEGSGGGQTISMSFVEIAGDSCHDLLNAFADAQLMTGQDGSVHAFPVVEPRVSNPDDLLAFISHGCAIRTTEATGVHDASSRSHAVLKIYIQNNNISEGCLTLVDLAGSEHRIDSMYHTAKLRKEGAQINASLMALKECVRAKAAGKNVGHIYRKSKLTMALKMSFLLPSAKTVVISTVSPSSKDTEHSLNTLRHACLMDGQVQEGNGRSSHLTGGNVRTVRVGEVQVGMEARKIKRASEKQKDSLLSNGNTFGGGRGHEEWAKAPTEKEIAKMHRQAERRAMHNMPERQRQILKQFRERLGRDPRQQKRLQQYSITPQVTRENNQSVSEASVQFYHKGLDGHRTVEETSRSKSFSQQWTEENITKSQNREKRYSQMQQARDGENEDTAPVATFDENQPVKGFGGGSNQRKWNESRGYDAKPQKGGCKKKLPKAPNSVFRKLKGIIYNDGSLHPDVKVKQFRRLLRSKGYSDEGVEERSSLRDGSSCNSNRRAVGSVPVVNKVRNQRLQADVEGGSQTTACEGELPYGGDINAAMSAQDRPAIRKIMASRSDYKTGASDDNGETHHAVQTEVPPMRSCKPTKSRHQLAQEKREALLAKEKLALETVVERKRMQQSGSHSRGGIYGDIEALEEKIRNANSAATKGGLKKQLAQKKAILVRQERQAKQAEREAQRAHEAEKKRQASLAAQQAQEEERYANASPDSPLARAMASFSSGHGVYGNASESEQMRQPPVLFDDQNMNCNRIPYDGGFADKPYGLQEHDQRANGGRSVTVTDTQPYVKGPSAPFAHGASMPYGSPQRSESIREIDPQNWSPELQLQAHQRRDQRGGVSSAPFANDYTWNQERY